MMKQSISMKMKCGLAILAIGASTLALANEHDVERERAHEGVHVGVRPPPARIEHAPPPRRGYQWTAGYWGWNGHEHVWFDGHWEAERPGFRFIEARWLFVGGEWVFYPGYWDPLPAPVVVVQQPVAPVVVQQAPTEYIEQQPAPQQSAPSPAEQDPNFWYYCHNPAGYYPYVKECAGGWQKVTPVPTGNGHP